MSKKSKVISFRLDPEMCKLLESLSTRTNASIQETARTLVIASLVGEDFAVNERIKQLAASIEDVRQGQSLSDKRLATALYHVLEQVGKMKPETAKKVAASILEIGDGRSK